MEVSAVVAGRQVGVRLRGRGVLLAHDELREALELPEDLLVELAGGDDPPERLDLPLQGLAVSRG